MAAVLRRLGKVVPVTNRLTKGNGAVPIPGLYPSIKIYGQAGNSRLISTTQNAGGRRITIGCLPQVQVDTPKFRSIAKTRCCLGNPRPLSTNGKAFLYPTHKGNLPRSGSTATKWSGTSEEFIEKFLSKMWQTYVSRTEAVVIETMLSWILAGIVVLEYGFLYIVFRAFGIDVSILQRKEGSELTQTEDGREALKVLSDALDDKDRQIRALKEGNVKTLKDKEKLSEKAAKEICELKEKLKDAQSENASAAELSRKAMMEISQLKDQLKVARANTASTEKLSEKAAKEICELKEKLKDAQSENASAAELSRKAMMEISQLKDQLKVARANTASTEKDED